MFNVDVCVYVCVCTRRPQFGRIKPLPACLPLPFPSKLLFVSRKHSVTPFVTKASSNQPVLIYIFSGGGGGGGTTQLYAYIQIPVYWFNSSSKVERYNNNNNNNSNKRNEKKVLLLMGIVGIWPLAELKL